MKRSLILLSIGFAVALPNTGRAEAPPLFARAPEGALRPAAVEYGFDDELVKGDLIRPEGEVVRGRRRGTRASLIEVRSDYVAELLKSVEDL